MEFFKSEAVQVALGLLAMPVWCGIGWLIGYEMIFLIILCAVVFSLMAIGGASAWLEKRANRPVTTTTAASEKPSAATRAQSPKKLLKIFMPLKKVEQ